MIFNIVLILMTMLFGTGCEYGKLTEEELSNLRKDMVNTQIIRRGITDKNVIKALRKVKRHEFVPTYLHDMAYGDNPLPIGHSQTISQPYIVAIMTELLNISENDRILEVGTGSGYQAAILGELAKEVYSVELLKPLADASSQLLKKLGYKNVHVKCGDGFKGWKDHAPFDKIIVTCAPKEIPPELLNQLKEGGLLVIPVGDFFQKLKLVKKEKGKIIKKDIFSVRFVPMIKGKESK